jgi:hypothetical protein
MSDDLILPFERRLTTQTDEQILALYLLGKIDVVKLSPKMTEKLFRLETCRDLYHKLRSQTKVVEEMTLLNFTRADGKETYQISKQTAYRDFEQCQNLFNIMFKTSGLNLHIEFLLRDIKETRDKAMADGDWKTASSCNKEYKDVLKEFFGNADAEKYRELQPPAIFTDFLPEQSKTPLPDDWEKQLQKVLDRKKRQELTIIEDVEIITEEDEPGDGTDEENS